MKLSDEQHRAFLRVCEFVDTFEKMLSFPDEFSKLSLILDLSNAKLQFGIQSLVSLFHAVRYELPIKMINYNSIIQISRSFLCSVGRTVLDPLHVKDLAWLMLYDPLDLDEVYYLTLVFFEAITPMK